MEKYSYDELVERSEDFEKLIDLLVEFSDIPPRLRGCSSERAKMHKITAEIQKIVQFNRKPYQNNVIQQNLFDL